MRLLRSRLFEPGLNCLNCQKHFFESKGRIKAPCTTALGCGIRDVAPSWKLNRQIEAFIQAEAMELSPAYAKVQERLMEEAGLFDETPETLMALKAVFAEWRKWDMERTKK